MSSSTNCYRMICRIRPYGSREEAVRDLRRLGIETGGQDLPGPAPWALLVEGLPDQVQGFFDQVPGAFSALILSGAGRRHRACVIAQDVWELERHLEGHERAATALRSYLSSGAPSIGFPGGRLDFDRPLVMGIVNATPDSFSDGTGRVVTDEKVELALRLVEEGADILDIGGESTRPGAIGVGTEEELHRTIPIVRRLVERTGVPISVDTRKPEVARAAVEAGAVMINDVSGLRDPAMVEVASRNGVPVVLMHMLGDPSTMQQTVGPGSYEDIIGDIMWFWEGRMEAAERDGLDRDRILLDPGIGFGKLMEHNLDILDRLREMRCSGRPLLVGASRKGFIGSITGEPASGRLGGSLAAAAMAALNGANIIRVHDVRETVGLIKVLNAIRGRIRA